MTEPHDRPEIFNSQPTTPAPVSPENIPVTPEAAAISTPEPAAFKPLSQDSQRLMVAMSVLGTQQGQAQLDGLVKAAAAQNPTAGSTNADLVKQRFIDWAVNFATTAEHAVLDRIPVLGPALETMADTAIHSAYVEAFLHTQLDIVIATVYRTIKNNSFFAKVANWIGFR